MKVVTLNKNYDDSWETEVLFAINDINNLNEVEVLKRVKNAIRPFIGSYFSLDTTDEKIELRATEFLNIVKQGKNEMWLDKYVYLDLEEVEVL